MSIAMLRDHSGNERHDDKTFKENCTYFDVTEALCFAYLTHFKADFIIFVAYNAIVK